MLGLVQTSAKPRLCGGRTVDPQAVNHTQTETDSGIETNRDGADLAFLAIAIAFALAVGGCVATGSVPF